MNFEALKRRVERSEALVEGRALQTQECYGRLKATWRASWTPTRILAAGLLAGFVAGRSAPTRALRRIGRLGGSRWLQLIGTVSGLVASLQSTVAAFTAKDAAKTAEHAAGEAEHAVDAAQSTAAAAPATAAADPASRPAGVHAQPPAVADAESSAVADRRRRPDPALHPQSRPAEAATDVSER